MLIGGIKLNELKMKYTIDQIRNAGIYVEISNIDIGHLIKCLAELYGDDNINDNIKTIPND